jgi:hypothetical protein
MCVPGHQCKEWLHSREPELDSGAGDAGLRALGPSSYKASRGGSSSTRNSRPKREASLRATSNVHRRLASASRSTGLLVLRRGILVATWSIGPDSGHPSAAGYCDDPMRADGDWGILLITACGTLLSLATGWLPQWKKENWPCNIKPTKTFYVNAR